MSSFTNKMDTQAHIDVHGAAERGHTATDSFGKSIVLLEPDAERCLRRKMDLYILPTVALLYLFCFIDRANIGNAKIAGFDRDLQLVGDDYNAILSIFYISYIIFEIPSNLACKWLGPGWFLPATSLGFGICSIGTAFVTSKAQAAGVRFLLGVFEAGVFPGIAYYLSRWYRRTELAFRLGLYVVMAPLAGAFGGLLASGILKLDHFGSLHSWRMIFGIEGIITIGLALISFATLTDSPSSASWLTQAEKDLALARIKSERIAQTSVVDGMDVHKLKRGVSNPVVLSTAVTFLLNNITVQGLAFFLPTIVRSIYPKETVITQQLYTVPPYVVGAFFTLLLPFLSGYFDRRQIIIILCSPLVIAGYIMFLASTNTNVRYGATFLIASTAFPMGVMTNAQVSANTISDTARNVGIGTNMMFGNLGGLIATWSFLQWDGPNYPIGNGLNLASSSTWLVLSVALMFWMKKDNARRETEQDAHVEQLADKKPSEIENLDWKHPAFRWKL